MKVTTEQIKRAVEAASFGDRSIIDLGDGKAIRVLVEPDPDHSIFDDGDWYGRLEWCRHQGRPKDFDGAARILDRDGLSTLWWQPPADIHGSALHDLRRAVEWLLNAGYWQVGAEILEGKDAYGRRIVTGSEWRGGVDALPGCDGRDYLVSVVLDHLAELGVEVVG